MRGYTISKEDSLKRLRRIEGQVRGLQRMIDEDTYCIDILNPGGGREQGAAGRRRGLLDEHVRGCVADAAKKGDDASTDAMVTEATRAIERLVKS